MRDALYLHGFACHIFTDDGASRKSIVTWVSEMKSKLVANDLLLIYFAGHGQPTVSERDLFLRTSADLEDDSLTLSHLIRLGATVKANVLIVVDVCGGILSSRDFESKTGSVGQVMLAARHSEKAAELPAAGTFTSLLVEALDGKAFQYFAESFLAVSQLLTWISLRMPPDQTPSCFPFSKPGFQIMFQSPITINKGIHSAPGEYDPPQTLRCVMVVVGKDFKIPPPLLFGDVVSGGLSQAVLPRPLRSIDLPGATLRLLDVDHSPGKPPVTWLVLIIRFANTISNTIAALRHYITAGVFICTESILKTSLSAGDETALQVQLLLGANPGSLGLASLPETLSIALTSSLAQLLRQSPAESKFADLPLEVCAI